VERTFLVTDIEGSSRLWESDPDAMRSNLAVHDEIVRRAIEQCEGTIFKTQGDAFFAVFGEPVSAIRAAQMSQEQLAAQNWTNSQQIKVRIVIHFGDADERGGDFFGKPLNRCARMLEVCHGGQVLVSEAVELLSRQSRGQFELLHLGRHRLRDLLRAESLYQLSNLQFPPIKGLEAVPNNLPVQTSSFVGRSRELEQIRSALDAHRLITLTGTGGSGKTRLAVQTAGNLLERFSDGCWFVALEGVVDSGAVASAAATAIGIVPNSKQTYLDQLKQYFSDRSALIVFDNCEHVLESAAETVHALVSTCPDLTILATSRERLHTPGEYLFRVPPLDVSSSESSVSEAAQLFVDRAAAVAPQFRLDDSSRADLEEIVRDLEGLPLLIELASARVSVLSLKQIASKLKDRIKLSTGQSSGVPMRQRTFRATMDWSYDGLSPSQQYAFRAASVFAGGWNYQAMEAVCCCPGEGDMLETLAALVDKSLVLVEDSGADECRYRFLGPIREYAQQKLRDCGEDAAAKDRHLKQFMEFAKEGNAQLAGSEQVFWLKQFAREHENLAAALGWCVEPEMRLTFCYHLARYWFVTGHMVEAEGWLQDALGRYQARDALRAKGLGALGSVLWSEGVLDRASEAFHEALSIWRDVGDKVWIASALNNIALIHQARGELEPARLLLEESIGALAELHDVHREGIALTNLMGIAQEQGDLERADGYAERAIALLERASDWSTLATTLYNRWTVLRMIHGPDFQLDLLKRSLKLAEEADNKSCIRLCLGGFSLAAVHNNQPESAVAFMVAAERLAAESGIKISDSEKKEVNRIWEEVRRNLGGDGLENAKKVASSMDLKSIIGKALTA